ncbi:Pimeloyl-ACP methyl ester carboxylesterase [Rathayibacter oskolensis]|uniref:Pimeloyl-ACP methyl ester carboxylesterase n=1 Tax=Rathayibacter oskolensis TaxID=1891671 RepID=A0A1X7N4N4_9MICO|nr:alpha/beta fold hydrolase [Rathayibacter oskolensis]SMH32352.1 Pimeloyl-ACP methyl ester carboxylesterase [Rathayibacter oskolensis]
MTRRAEFLERQAALVRESTVDVGGAPVRLLSAGAPSTSLVLLVTGPGRGVRADSALLLPMLARRRRVAALELADLADPGRDGARAVGAALDALGAEDAVVVGHSLGAAVAISAAGDPRLRALALVAGWLRPTERLETFARLWESLAARPEARADLARLIAVRSLAELGPGRPSPFAVDSALVAAAAGADSLAGAARVRVPTLVVGCAADAVVGIEGAEALVGAIEDARYAVVDSGHAVLAERPAELLALLEHFLADPHRDPAGSVLPRMRV